MYGGRLPSQPDKPIGKYGRMRKRYLKEHRPALFSSLILSEKLYPHLLEIDETANRRLDIIMPELMKSSGLTEQIIASDPMKWAGLMNTPKAQAEEIILSFIRIDLWVTNSGGTHRVPSLLSFDMS